MQRSRHNHAAGALRRPEAAKVLLSGRTGVDPSTSREQSVPERLCRRSPFHFSSRSGPRRIFSRRCQRFGLPTLRVVVLHSARHCALHFVLPVRQLTMRFFSGLLFVRRLLWTQQSSASFVLRRFHPSAWQRSSATIRELRRSSHRPSVLPFFRYRSARKLCV